MHRISRTPIGAVDGPPAALTRDRDGRTDIRETAAAERSHCGAHGVRAADSAASTARTPGCQMVRRFLFGSHLGSHHEPRLEHYRPLCPGLVGLPRRNAQKWRGVEPLRPTCPTSSFIEFLRLAAVRYHQHMRWHRVADTSRITGSPGEASHAASHHRKCPTILMLTAFAASVAISASSPRTAQHDTTSCPPPSHRANMSPYSWRAVRKKVSE